MQPLKSFTIIPSLPEKLSPMRDIAYNLWWAWDREAIDMFYRLDRNLWEETGHNPVKLLGQISQSRLNQRAEDDGYVAVVERVAKKLETYLKANTWYEKKYGDNKEIKIAYFSAEFGLTECLQNYSGGLGVLAGDHMKSASELGLPLVGVGLLYQVGYFHQYLNADGWQNEMYPENDFYNLPIQLVRNQDDDPQIIEVDYPGRKVFAQIWRVQVGRVQLYLLDTNIAQNRDADQNITDELYGGNDENRIQQEIMLGIGGIRTLKALGLHPSVFHMNEGHSAFLALERIRCAMEENQLSFDEAIDLIKAGNVFTTHTPVPAGIDHFPPQLLEKYFAHYYPQLKLNKSSFLGLGRREPANDSEQFSMAILAIRLASHINGVSKLHGQVSRDMWSDLWPGVPKSEIPITSVTNGIHPSSWISKDMGSLYDRYLGPTWMRKPVDVTIWKRVEQIPAEELWRTHERRRERLVAFARNRLKTQLERQGAFPSEIVKADEVLNPEALTIGFARRFATYKRAALLFHDPVRMAQIIRNRERPVQILFAGKAHPQDTPGKELIKKIIHLARMEDFRQHIVFLEDYDMAVARYLVQGVDVWLNTPRRLLEASGTSGMKAAVNGVLNLSVLDGWWDEAYTPNLGWSIGSGEQYDDLDYQDEVESQALYNLLEKEVIPLFYDRGKSNVPRKWIDMMKNSMSAISPIYNTNRMLGEYTERFYISALDKQNRMHENDQQRSKDLAAWKKRVQSNWSKIKFVDVQGDGEKEYPMGAQIAIVAKVELGDLSPEDVSVEIYHGKIDTQNEVATGKIDEMHCTSSDDKVCTFEGKIECALSGQYGYTVRILPKHEDLVHAHETGLILWAS
ncbi:MAG: alpha-glucan family phosphorylase [candidate division KSB1 bacterium]|jgi:starch phosphorylase|nr:alpha-glucan family phosphorylase [candidate division KSB1 bacterium]